MQEMYKNANASTYNQQTDYILSKRRIFNSQYRYVYTVNTLKQGLHYKQLYTITYMWYINRILSANLHADSWLNDSDKY